MLKELIGTIEDDDTIWVMENRDNADNIFKEYITDKLFSSTYIILSRNKAYVFVHKLDEGNIEVLDSNYAEVFIYSKQIELLEDIKSVLNKLDFPKKMLLNYTTISDESTDIITHSSYLRVSKMFRRIYKEYDKKVSIKSAEKNIYKIISRNTNEEIEKMKILANMTDEILKRSFKSIKIGQSEKDIARQTQEITKEYIECVKEKYEIVDYDMAWDICPIVLVGENLKKGGHALPSQKKILKGDTIYYDFGIKCVFKDGTCLYTDMQRMGYSLKDKEKGVNKSVQKVFDTLVTSIDLGIECLKPGVKAYKIDDIVRGYITKHGYPEYMHATGHPVRS